MGIFGSMFGKGEASGEPDNAQDRWQPLNQRSDLDKVVALSEDRPQILFKHSTRCGISRMVWTMLKGRVQISEEKADLYWIDLLANRDLSDLIATQFQVSHQSPQLLVVKNGSVVAHASHGAIPEMDLQQYL